MMSKEQDTGGWCAPTEEEARGWPKPTEDTWHFGLVSDAAAIQAFNNMGILHDALDLVAELWPKPGYQTVIMNREQWDKLRRVLLSIPEILAADE